MYVSSATISCATLDGSIKGHFHQLWRRTGAIRLELVDKFGRKIEGLPWTLVVVEGYIEQAISMHGNNLANSKLFIRSKACLYVLSHAKRPLRLGDRGERVWRLERNREEESTSAISLKGKREGKQASSDIAPKRNGEDKV